jgi:tetrapyrrole methylase family protein / MazG family protein
MSNKQRSFSPQELGQFRTFREIVRHLRSAEGCPWDRQQTHSSLKKYLLEECYEVLETIEDQDMKSLCEELGDLWLQIMLHSQIAEERKEFTIEDVLRGINNKMIYRHPHVFSDEEVKDEHEVSQNWEELKERDKKEYQSLLSSVPRELPALAYSQSIQRRAASVGFDWEKVEDIMVKLVEEVEELRKAVDQKEKENEFGDILLTLANVARRMDIDLESSLRQANSRFTCRFNYIEDICRKRSVDLKSLTLAEMDILWNEAKDVLK